MEKKKTDRQKQTDNTKEKLDRAANAVSDTNQNQHHNVKKVAQGPNTKR